MAVDLSGDRFKMVAHVGTHKKYLKVTRLQNFLKGAVCCPLQAVQFLSI